jgi:hypothetical protein
MSQTNKKYSTRIHDVYGFKVTRLNLAEFNFDNLCMLNKFEDVAKGRQCAIINKSNALIRTTTNYKNPAQEFKNLHTYIDQVIRERLGKSNQVVNNAMIEIYEPSYRKMGFHTDQAQDLDSNSWIYVYSCYENGNVDRSEHRSFIIQDKLTSKEWIIPMENNSVIAFSTDTNHKFRHKIAFGPEDMYNSTDKRWLGITFRTSKTNVVFNEYGIPKNLRIATEEERQAIYKMKSDENNLVDHEWTKLEYTLSSSDLMPIDNSII